MRTKTAWLIVRDAVNPVADRLEELVADGDESVKSNLEELDEAIQTLNARLT